MMQQLSTSVGGSADGLHSSRELWLFRSRRVDQNTGRDGVYLSYQKYSLPEWTSPCCLQISRVPGTGEDLGKGCKGRQGCEVARELPRLPGGWTEARFSSEPRSPLPEGESVVSQDHRAASICHKKAAAATSNAQPLLSAALNTSSYLSFPQEVVYALLLFLNFYHLQILYLKISCLHPHITTDQNREAVDEGKFVQQLCRCQPPDKSFAFKSPLTLVPLGFTICHTPRSSFQRL